MRRSTLAVPLAAGQAQAFFRIATSGDQMGQTTRPARLEAVVRVKDQELVRTIAACQSPSTGSALGGGGERELEVALCDGEFWLVSEPGVVRVEEMTAPNQRREVARFELGGAEVRAVSPPAP